MQVPRGSFSQLISRCYALCYVIRHKARKLVLVPRVERTLFVITAGLKTNGLVPGESAIAVLGFHEVSLAKGPK